MFSSLIKPTLNYLALMMSGGKQVPLIMSLTLAVPAVGHGGGSIMPFGVFQQLKPGDW